MMTFSVRYAFSLVCLLAFAFTSCDSTNKDANSARGNKTDGSQVQGTAATTSNGKLNMSASTGTIHQMTAEMVKLMDDVNNKKIMSPPIKVSDVRNAFMERLDWIDEMSAEDVTKLRQATADLDALIAEIRAHENAGEAALQARLKKIEDWNRSIKDGIPQ